MRRASRAVPGTAGPVAARGEVPILELSSASSAVISLPYLATRPGFTLHLEETLTRREFEAMTRDLLDRCRGPVERVLRDAGIRMSDLDPPAENRTLAVLELTGLACQPPPTPLVFVIYDIDANGVLRVTARELSGRTDELPDRARALERSAEVLTHGPEEERARLETAYCTGRKWSATVDRATMARAAALVASPQWPALHARVPACWHFPPQPTPSVRAS